MAVYIISKDGKPLMPTTRYGHVRWLLKQKKARVVGTDPFVIQLNYDTENKTQGIVLGIDPGRTNIGISAVLTDGKCVLSAELTSRNKDVTKLMTERKAHRIARRRGKRLRKQRRAVKNNTAFASERERFLPHYEKPITLKFIKNKEARFCNRRRPEDWLTPTVRHCVQTHINLISKLCRILPITKISIEVNCFDFQLMDNPFIKGWQYQRGSLFGYKDVNDYVSHYQDGICLLCGGKIEHYHHIVPRHEGGSNCFENIAGLCEHCHTAVHTDPDAHKQLLSKKDGLMKKYAGSSVLNAAMPYVVQELGEHFDIWLTTGRETKAFRDKNFTPKTHFNDAYCIACSAMDNINISVPEYCFRMKQYRRHDRACIHKANISRKYYLGKELVATNRHKAMEQKVQSLEEYRQELIESVGQAQTEKIISQLTVKEHNPIYKDRNRVMPGAVFTVNGIVHTLKGTQGRYKGQPSYYVSEDGTKHRCKDCSIRKHNLGINFLQEMMA